LAGPLLVNNYFNKYSLMIRQFIDVIGSHKQAYIYDNYPALDMALYRRRGLGRHLISTGQIYRGLLLKRKYGAITGLSTPFKRRILRRGNNEILKIPISKIIGKPMQDAAEVRRRRKGRAAHLHP